MPNRHVLGWYILSHCSSVLPWTHGSWIESLPGLVLSLFLVLLEHSPETEMLLASNQNNMSFPANILSWLTFSYEMLFFSFFVALNFVMGAQNIEGLNGNCQMQCIKMHFNWHLKSLDIMILIYFWSLRNVMVSKNVFRTWKQRK